MPANKSRFNIMVRWFEGKELDRKTFNIFIYELKQTGYSPSYLNNFIKLAKHIFKYLSSEELKDYSYFPTESPEEDPLSPQEIVKLAEIPMKYTRYKPRRPKYKALIYFLGNVGSRIEETLKLEWKDLQENPLYLVHFRAENTKTKKNRYCPIPKWLYQMLIKLPHESELVFNRLERSNFNEDLKVRATKCGIKKNVHPHLFRDSSINNKLACGVPLEQVTAYHGHTTTNTTYKYYVRIKAKQLAQSLYSLDPAYQSEQTLEMIAQKYKEDLDKTINKKKFDYQIEEYEGSLKFEVHLKEALRPL